MTNAGDSKRLTRQLNDNRHANDQRRFKLALRHLSNRQLLAQFANETDPWAKRQIQIEGKRRDRK